MFIVKRVIKIYIWNSIELFSSVKFCATTTEKNIAVIHVASQQFPVSTAGEAQRKWYNWLNPCKLKTAALLSQILISCQQTSNESIELKRGSTKSWLGREWNISTNTNEQVKGLGSVFILSCVPLVQQCFVNQSDTTAVNFLRETLSDPDVGFFFKRWNSWSPVKFKVSLCWVCK